MISEEEEEQYQEQGKSDSLNLISSENQIQLKTIDKISVKISKQRKKRRVRLQWAPLFTRTLQTDQDPIFLYNYLRVMKNYSDSEYNKFKNFGFQDAGIGIIQQLQLDKVNESIDMSMVTVSNGICNYQKLIKLFKSYSQQQYYDLALALEEYEVWTQKNYDILKQSIEIAQKFIPQEWVEMLDSQYSNFEKNVKEWSNKEFSNEIYQIVLGNISIQQKIPILKKEIFSKNLIYFLGSNLEKMYVDMSAQKNKDFLSSIMRGGECSGMFVLERTIKTIKETIKENLEYEIDDEIVTLEGYIIPAKRKVQVFFHDLLTGQISKQPHLQFIIVSTFNFEPHWIQYLIQKRAEYQMNISHIIDQICRNDIYNFDYTCQKEYFLEKYYSHLSQQNYRK